MNPNMNTGFKMEHCQAALGSLKQLRANIGQMFEILGNGVHTEQNEDGKDGKYVQELQDQMSTIYQNLRDLDGMVNLLQPPMPGLANTTYLAQETTAERQGLYPQLVNCYKWIDKIHDYSSTATGYLTANALKRSYNHLSNKLQMNRRRLPTLIFNYSPQAIDNILNKLVSSYPEIKLKICRPFGGSTIVHINLSRILKAALILKGITVEWITIKGLDESLDEIDDLWTDSRYAVFRHVQDHAHAAISHFYSPTVPDLTVRSIITWLHSYLRLFSDPCLKCKNLLLNGLPPTWRNFRTLEPYHQDCK